MSKSMSFTSLEAFGEHWFATHPEQERAEHAVVGDEVAAYPPEGREIAVGVAVAVAEPPPMVDEALLSNWNTESPSNHPSDGPREEADAGQAGACDGLGALLRRLEEASLTLTRLVRQDEEARSLALRDVERYDAAVAAQREAEGALRRAEQERARAERVAQAGFADRNRAEAAQILELANQVAEAAGRILEERRAEVDALAARPEIARLLAERREAEEAEKARAAAARRAERLSCAVAQVREALVAGRVEEAKSRLGTVASLDPDCSVLNSLKEMIARREFAVKVSAAEAALRTVRGGQRRQPAAVVAILEALDVVGLPEHLSREIFGRWLRAWTTLCEEMGVEEPLRYAPEQGRGAILAHDGADGRCKVLGALGMGPRWKAGCAIGPAVLRRSRPLR